MKRVCTYTLLWAFTFVFSQQPEKFIKEVATIQSRIAKTHTKDKKTIVFTGSSSIRLWNDLQQRFPNKTILNTAFGGSTTEDLLMFCEELITNYQPYKVFIYEGDNDINFKRKPSKILQDLKALIRRIKIKSPQTNIYLISPKPSISRWKWRGKYQKLNQKIKNYANNTPGVTFINVWDIMLINQKLNPNLFIEDGLHMNTTGYDLWQKKIQPFVHE